jgi:DNA adenine methylase
MSPNHPRFNIRSIEKLENFNIQNFTVENKSFEESIMENSGSLFYLDPPYLIKNMLYGKKGDTHKGFDHIKLKEIITEEKNWIMSYNSSEEIIEIYKDYNYILPKWKYGMSKNKESNEILIFSKNVFEYLKDNKKL